MAVEKARGCGFRKAGGLYITGDLDNAIAVDYLPCCIEFPHARGMAWVDPKRLLRTCADERAGGYRKLEKIALMWVGKEHYTTKTFTDEALTMGVSKRVSFVPHDLKPGDPIALAHVAAITAVREKEMLTSPHCRVCRHLPAAKAMTNMMTGLGQQLIREKSGNEDGGPKGAGDPKEVPGVFCLFRMKQVELVLPKHVARDKDIKAKCAARGIKIVEVPDKDKDHVPPGWKLPRFLLDDQTEMDLASGDD